MIYTTSQFTTQPDDGLKTADTRSCVCINKLTFGRLNSFFLFKYVNYTELSYQLVEDQ